MTNRRLLDADMLLNHLETEEVKLIQLYPKNAYGIRKVISRLKFFIADGEFDAPPSLDRQAVIDRINAKMDELSPEWNKFFRAGFIDELLAEIESGRVGG